MSKNPNIIIISIDTFRPHLGCYGYKIKTPNLDKLAHEGARFSQVFVEEPITGASHASMLTSMYSHHHGGHANFENTGPIKPSVTTTAQVLRRKGYKTAGFISTSNLSDSVSGLGRGFEKYYEEGIPKRTRTPRDSKREEPKDEERSKVLARIGYCEGGRVTKAAVDWLEKNHERTFFLWMHYWDPHAPFIPPEPFDKMYLRKEDYVNGLSLFGISRKFRDMNEEGQARVIRQLVGLYNGEITFTDKCIGEVISSITDLGMLEHTIITIHGDHGEFFGEHGFLDKPPYLYDPLIRVPLIMRYPAVIPANMVVESIVQNIDIVPTILDTLDIHIPESMDGRSLLPIFRGEKREVRMEAYTEHPQKVYSIRTKRWKFIKAEGSPRRVDEEELYDLEIDLEEKNSLVSEKKNAVKKLRGKLMDWIAS